MDLPEKFQRTIQSTFGSEGALWLRRLPYLLEEIARRWGLTVGPPVADLSYNYVAPARLADGGEAMLKLGVPNLELETEIAALQVYDGRGAVRLLKQDSEQGALLLERLRPGQMLVTLENDEAATVIAAEVMRKLWRPAPEGHPFPTAAEWAQGLTRYRQQCPDGGGPIPGELFSEAEGLFAELLASQSAPVVLHGDLHHYNILTSDRGPWLAIDPKGVIGEPEYEVGALLCNPLHLLELPDLPQRMARRVALLSEVLGFDRARVRGWGLAQAVLSACWTFEEGGGAEDMRNALRCAKLLSALKA